MSAHPGLELSWLSWLSWLMPDQRGDQPPDQLADELLADDEAAGRAQTTSALPPLPWARTTLSPCDNCDSGRPGNLVDELIRAVTVGPSGRTIEIDVDESDRSVPRSMSSTL